MSNRNLQYQISITNSRRPELGFEKYLSTVKNGEKCLASLPFHPGELFICLFRIAYEWFIYTASKDSIEEK